MRLRRDFVVGSACAVAVVLIWALFIVYSRASVRRDVGVWDLAFLRFAFAAVTVLPFLIARPAGRRLGSLGWQHAVVLAAFGGLGFTCLAFLGFSMAPAAHGAVLMPGTLPFSTALAAYVLMGERVGARKAAGLMAILFGVALMAAQAVADGGAGAWAGDALFPLASGSWAVFAVLSRKWRVDPVDATLVVPSVAFMLYAPIYLVLAGEGLSGLAPGAILSMGIFQGPFALVASMWAFSRVMAVFGPVRTTMITALAPGLAAVLAVLFLGEAMPWMVGAGLIAVTAGMIIGVGGGNGLAQPSVK